MHRLVLSTTRAIPYKGPCSPSSFLRRRRKSSGYVFIIIKEGSRKAGSLLPLPSMKRRRQLLRTSSSRSARKTVAWFTGQGACRPGSRKTPGPSFFSTGTGNSPAATTGVWVISKPARSEEHTSELQSRPHLVCRLLLEKKKSDHDVRDARFDHPTGELHEWPSLHDRLEGID